MKFPVNTCRLLIYLQKESVYFLLVSKESNKLRFCRAYQNTLQVSEGVFLRLVLSSAPDLIREVSERIVVVGAHRFSMVPNALFQEREKLKLARMLFSEQCAESELHYHDLASPDAKVLFTFPPATMHILEHYLGNFSLRHLSYWDTLMGQDLAQQHREHLLVHLTQQQMLLTAYSRGKLQLCNAYLCQTPLDTLYFIHTVRQVLELHPEVPTWLVGEFEEKGTLVKNIRKQMANLQIYQEPRRFLDAASGTTPFWKFAFLAWA